MCRSIKTLRQHNGLATDDEIRAAALQFVRKVSGYRQPSQANTEAFYNAVDDIATATRHMLITLKTRRMAYATQNKTIHPEKNNV